MTGSVRSRARSISDAFEERRAWIEAATRDPDSDYHCRTEEERRAVLEDRDEYLGENVFWVPAEARWSVLQAAVKQPTIGRLVDDAMAAIEKENLAIRGIEGNLGPSHADSFRNDLHPNPRAGFVLARPST